jgi:hypothetical protein
MEQNNYQDVTSLLQTLRSLPGYGVVPDAESDIVYAQRMDQQDRNDILGHDGAHHTATNAYGYNQHGQAAHYDQTYPPDIPAAFDFAGLYSGGYMHPNTVSALPQQQYYYPPPQQPDLTIPPQLQQVQLQQPEPVIPSNPRRPAVNPRTITTWPAALRHITFLSVDPQFGPAVKKLITNQHNNEKQWWASRLALIEKQRTRVNGKQELNDVLKSLGGMTDRSSEAAVDDAAELRAYDKKVHRAATQMEKAMVADLVSMGVPFFKIEERLILEDDLGEASEKGRITSKQLKVLQMRILQHLEDMYSE